MHRREDFLASPEPEKTFFDDLSYFVQRSTTAPKQEWHRGQPLQILLAGYLGGNVGAEMRSLEIIRHIRHVVGDDNVSFTAIFTGNHIRPDFSSQTTVSHLAGYVPEAIVNYATRHHAVVACEGSMLKSSFSNALAGVMSAALATTAARGQLSIGYGAEIASMEPLLEEFVRQIGPGASFFCRNEASLNAARSLGLRASAGADTAWTFQVAPAVEADHAFRSLGIDPDIPILAICPVNPFWWPVRPNPSLARAAETDDALRGLLYGDVFFHTWDESRSKKYIKYIGALADATKVLAREYGAQPVLFAMETIDAAACRNLSSRLARAVPIIHGFENDLRLFVSMLRRARFIVSSRFHALVGTAPEAVPFAGVATDERIKNLLDAGGCSEAFIPADDPELAERIIAVSRGVDEDELRSNMRRLVASQIHLCGKMAMDFADELVAAMPDFPLPERRRNWETYLPPLPATVQELLSS
jgi:polysaccharide pyruvyl transferase WcaK-like protein